VTRRAGTGSSMFRYESEAAQKGFSRIAGVDEAGRGPLAGPVLAAAVVLPDGFSNPGIADSKTLTPARRERLFTAIYDGAAAIGIGIIDTAEIDRTNILAAARLAMAVAVENLRPRPDHLLIDGPFTIDVDIPQTAIPKGDSLSISVAAASIVAKVTRDRIMARYSEEYPLFGFSAHKGYPTRAHRAAIRAHGPCPIHRRTFRGVREQCSISNDQ
jgi:ribonuclease HII